jgi:predicted permease
MFSSIFNRAQRTVDNAIGQAVNRLIIATPFLIATGFGTAAMYLRLDREYGAETATLILAAAFSIVGLLALAILLPRRSQLDAPAAEAPAAASASDADQTGTAPSMSDSDRELLMAALTSAAPIALPGLVRTLLRNLPLVAVIIAAFLVMTHQPTAQSADEVPTAA